MIKNTFLKFLVKKYARFLSNFFNPKLIERFKEVSILTHTYSKLKFTKVFENREGLWIDTFLNLKNQEINLLEFGVFEGYSIKYFSSLNKNPESKFYGFDSFYGLPEDWVSQWQKSVFDLKGQAPISEDSRIFFIKGWFQNSLPKNLSKFNKKENLIVHFDADLYSSTLFCLMQLDSLKTDYYAIFDEFMAGEIGALENYQQATGAKVEFIGKTIYQGLPQQVSCRIFPAKIYEV